MCLGRLIACVVGATRTAPRDGVRSRPQTGAVVAAFRHAGLREPLPLALLTFQRRPRFPAPELGGAEFHPGAQLAGGRADIRTVNRSPAISSSPAMADSSR